MTKQKLPAPIKLKFGMAKKIAEHHFGKPVSNIEFKPAGKTNAVFDVTTRKGNFIIRIAPSRTRINEFLKEQWATQKARDAGVPTPEVLEVGNEIIPLPYMIQTKAKGKEAVDHPARLQILKDLGAYARRIHTIPTQGYGKMFNWSKNQLSRKKTWIEFLETELRLDEGMNYLVEVQLLDRKKIGRLNLYFNKLRKWKLPPSLNHCDLRLKNVIVDDDGKIQAIIDWENCMSNVAPYWDLSIALHDLSIDAKQSFLEGYGIDNEEFEKLSYALTAFNLVNYVPSIREIIKKKDTAKLELYRLRLNGHLDLFSL